MANHWSCIPKANSVRTMQQRWPGGIFQWSGLVDPDGAEHPMPNSFTSVTPLGQCLTANSYLIAVSLLIKHHILISGVKRIHQHLHVRVTPARLRSRDQATDIQENTL